MPQRLATSSILAPEVISVKISRSFLSCMNVDSSAIMSLSRGEMFLRDRRQKR